MNLGTERETRMVVQGPVGQQRAEKHGLLLRGEHRGEEGN